MSVFADRYDPPSEHDVETAVQGLRLDESEANQLRAFYARERRAAKLNWRKVGWYALKVIFWTLAVAAILILWMAL